MPNVTPLDVYKAYPGTEFLPIRAPLENEAWHDWMEYLEKQERAGSLGETLFLFVMREFDDGTNAVSVNDACLLINKAINDLYSVKTALDALDPQSAAL